MDDVYDDYLQAIVDYTGGLRVGDPMDPATDVGPMVSSGAASEGPKTRSRRRLRPEPKW